MQGPMHADKPYRIFRSDVLAGIRELLDRLNNF